DDQNVWTYDHQGEFVKVPKSTDSIQLSFLRFRNYIRIRDRRGPFRQCNFTYSDWRADAMSAFMNFQQIRSLFNNTKTDDLGKKYLYTYEKLILKNYQIHAISQRRGFPKRAKNKIASFLLTSDQKSLLTLNLENKEDFTEEEFKEIYEGNLSGLCPPGCKSFRYPLKN
ncbi:MAG: hypothetical protein WBA74_25760, partial [Cyclobacteriaceae bacterium]